MCRIAGIIGENKNRLDHDIALLTSVMHRGGPDDSGHYIDEHYSLALGHRRLSIIDLSEAASQPMHDITGRLIISFNGEIYNYLELRKELVAKGYLFKSYSDTEVILNGYTEWGIEGLLKKLNGMFAFLLFDKQKSKFIAARDHLGIKPLYYGKHGGRFYFSSEIRALKKLHPEWSENPDWGIWFLTLGFIPEPNTTLKNVSIIPKGHYLEFCLTSNSYKIIQYEKDTFHIEAYNAKEAIDLTKKTVTKAIEDQLIADVPIGVLLSGGLDSSIITTIAQRKHKEKLHSLSIYFDCERYDERKFQDLVVNRTGVIHKSFRVTEDLYMAELPSIIGAMDQPTIDGVNTYFISKYANEIGLKVVLSGLGADEFFGGYDSFTPRNVKFQKLKTISKVFGQFAGGYPLKKLSFLDEDRWYNNYLLNRGLFVPSDTAKITGYSQNKVNTILNTYFVSEIYPKLDDGNKISFEESTIYMQNQLLRDSDIFSMWHGLELRVPFLDKNVISLSKSISPNIKFNKNQKKYLLIEAFKEDLPREIWDRKKQGFGFPFESWYPNHIYLRNTIFLPKEIQRKFEKGKLNFNRVWAVFLYRCFFEDISSEVKCSTNNTRLLFTYLCAFSKTGGIEKVNKTILRSLSENSNGNEVAEGISLYDKQVDSRYFSKLRFKGFGGNKRSYVIHFLKCKIPWNKVIIGHINLLPIVLVLKWRKPSIQIIFVVHGIEVWSKFNLFTKYLINYTDRIISVSEYTKQKLVEINKIDPTKIFVLANSLDPFFKRIYSFEKPSYLLERYKLKAEEKIVLSFTRVCKQDRYKGYIQVIESIARLKSRMPNILYLICGNITKDEHLFLQQIIEELNIVNHVRFLGFIQDDELQDHFLLADVFALPSKKEGFGLVFIEAAAMGLPVIAGNEDASFEALLYGRIGTVVNVDNIESIESAIEQSFIEPIEKINLIEKVWSEYDFRLYRKKLSIMLDELDEANE